MEEKAGEGPVTVEVMIGAEARCSEGLCGQVRRVVIDPATRDVTDLVVEPKHRQGLGRLVPLDLVDVSTGEVRLRCTATEFDALGHAEETAFLPASGGRTEYPAGQALPQPYDGLGDTIGDVPEPVTYDTVPSGEAEVSPGERVHATDGPIGSVRGVEFDPRTGQVSHLLVREGHAWGHKNVAVPMGAVTAIDSGIHLNLAKRDVRELPPTGKS